MRGVNRVMLIGNLGKDPHVDYLDGNIGVAKFPLATTETYKDRNGKLVSQTEWHTVVLWRGLADLAAKYLHKGSLVYIEGRLRTRSWEDKEGNKKRIYLRNAAGTHIRRHKKIIAHATPFDLNYKEYFRKREEERKARVHIINHDNSAGLKTIQSYAGSSGLP